LFLKKSIFWGDPDFFPDPGTRPYLEIAANDVDNDDEEALAAYD
jgi:hypothetical protein